MSLIEQVMAAERAVGAGDWDLASRYLSPDIRYRVGARPVTVGIPAFRAYMELQSSVVDWRGHETLLVVEQPEILIVEVLSKFTRRADGVQFDLPCTDIYRFDAGRIADWRVYSDIAQLALPA